MSPSARQSSPQTQRLDFSWPSLFIVATAVILGMVTPVYIRFEPRVAETLAVVLVIGALLAWGVIRRKLLIILSATTTLFIVIFAGISTQPQTFNTQAVTIWPLRIFLILLVITAWLLFLAPSGWARRAVVAFSAPTALILLVVGGPAMIGQTPALFYNGAPVMNRNFAAQFLEINSHNTLYAGDLEGGLVWVFDSSGNLQGTIRPSAAPPFPTPGPGIVPSGFEAELGLPALTRPSPTPLRVLSSFCGMASDPQDNLYLLDTVGQSQVNVIRFNAEGNITARWLAPDKYQPSNDCIAADANYIYLSGIGGHIYLLDHEGTQVGRVDLPFQPWAIAESTGGTDQQRRLLAAGPGALASIEVNGGKIVTATLPPPPPQFQFPIFVRHNGELLLSDHQRLEVVQWDVKNGRALGTIGGPGVLPGQLGDIGGLAEDSSGRVYIADSINRAIQRFGTDGKIDAVWTAKDPNESEAGERR